MQKNLLAVGIILLKEQMNFPIDSTLDIAPLPANDPDNNPACAIVATSVTADQLYALALTHTPKALAAKSSAAASKMALQIARGARFPTVSVSAGFGTGFARAYGKAYTPFKYQLRNNVGYSIGASLNIPIFSGLSTTSAIARSRHQATIASIERDSALRSLYTEIEQAIADMNGSADAHTQALRQREATSVAHDVNRRKYDEGLASALELHTSTNRLAQARADELRSRLNYILKKRMVDYFAGTPLVPATN
jgi:outer membrane protein